MRPTDEPAVPLGRDAHGQWLYAPIGQLTACDADTLIICHACGHALAHLSAAHLRTHNLNAAQYRETYGLNRQQALMSPTILATRAEGGRRRIQLPAVQHGLAHGQRMACDGTLLALSHAAQTPGHARLQKRTTVRSSLATTRQRQQTEAAQRRDTRARELGYTETSAYLSARQQQGATPFAMARELRCGNTKTIQRLLAQLGNHER